jgi:hypothetical protein
MRYGLFCFLFILYSLHAVAQWSPECTDVNIQYGNILKHTVRFKPAIEKNSWAVECNLVFKPDTTKHWQHTYRLPQRGITVSARRFGNDEILGYGYGVMPFIHLPIWRTHSSEFQFRLATGVAFLPKHYDVIRNPDNNVIACTVNNISSFGLRFQTQLFKQGAFSASATFTHYSTGDARLPNLGINVPALSLGYVYYFKEHRPISPGKTGAQESYLNKHVIKRIKASTARFESFRPNGPLYIQINTEAAAGKYLSSWNKIFIAADVYYNSFAYHFIIHQELEPISNALKKSIGSSVMLEDEFVFGRVSLLVAWAYVLDQPYLRGGNDYQRLGAQYRFINHPRRKAFCGVYLKTHWANAELVATGLGFEW